MVAMAESVGRLNVLGVGINPVTMQETLSAMQAALEGGSPHYICVAAIHSVLDCQRDPELRRIFNASLLTTADGMPLVWMARLSGRGPTERVYGPDLLLAACTHSWLSRRRHFFLGGEPGVPEALAENLKRSNAHLNVVGGFSPPFHELSREEDLAVVDYVNRAAPDLVWVGLGTGKQERWMAGHLGLIQAPLMIGVGVAFDYHSGRKPQAPLWMRRSGLEWLFRLAREPRRLGRRYAAYPWFFVLLLAQLTRVRRFPLYDA
jgi:N-acetylglucosaminyldiphosphoundecaprenol N-acetyl-beta-D-mannosaminyltransferase